MIDVAAIADATLGALGDNDECEFTHNETGIKIRCKFGYGDQPPLIFRMAVPIGIDDGFTLAYNMCFTLISEHGNNDTCDLLIRERSAHFGYHGDLDPSDENEYVIYDAVVLDYMS